MTKAEYRSKHVVCEACRRALADHTHHIRTVGAGGLDESANFLALCAGCHAKVHSMGRETFAKEHLLVRRKMMVAVNIEKTLAQGAVGTAGKD